MEIGIALEKLNIRKTTINTVKKLVISDRYLYHIS